MNTHATIHVASILSAALSAAPAVAQVLNWSQLAPVSWPSARFRHAMAYDAARQRVVLFGGPYADTWEWDGTNWTQFTPSVSPPARYDPAMAYDSARQKVVLFGGLTGTGTALGDTWEWNGTNIWTQRTPASSPPIRYGHAMAYDSARQRVVLFGGDNPSPGPLADTWEWDGSTWVAGFSTSYPIGRSDHAMAYDAARQRVVLFGGYGGGYLGDTWEWDGTTWAQSTPSLSPSARVDHAMAYYAAGQRVVLFGGWNSLATYLGDTWINGTPTTLASASAFGAGCGSPALGFTPDAAGRPLLGQTGSATIVNAPTPVAAVAIGWSDQFWGPFVLPVTLTGIGMTGCDLLQSADLLGLGTSPLTPSTLSFSVAIPNAPSLIGVRLYMQAYAFAPGVNPLQLIISNGIGWIFGSV